jgi:hypothetical protein
MKKITLLMATVFTATMAFSQVVVRLTSVPCNTGLEGSYPYQISDWAMTPDMFLGINAVSGPLEFINDGTPGIVGDGIDNDNWPTPPTASPGSVIGSPPLQNVPKGYLAGDTTTAALQDMTGKIAVCYRGSYEFGFKAYNAQLRGAIGIIIINHTGDAVGMAPGSYGDLVTIPVVQIGRIAGDDIRVAIESCASNTVMGFIGTKVGLFANDMGSSIADIVMPNELTIPSGAVNDNTGASIYPINLGFWAFNYGTSNQNGVIASVNIVYNGSSSVYSNTAAPLDFVAPAANVVDTQYFSLGTFAPATWNEGEYAITYTLAISGTDEDTADNAYTVIFRVTNSVFAKSPTNTESIPLPIANTAYSLNQSVTQFSYWEPCIVFRSPVVATSTAQGGILTGMTFSATPVNGVMTDELLEIRAYEWNNTFTNLTPFFPMTDANVTSTYFSQITQVADELYYFAGTSDSLDNIYVPFSTPFPLSNNQRYLFCMYNAADMLRIGYNSQVDYTATVDNYLQPVAPVRLKPATAAVVWQYYGFGWEDVPAISASIDFGTSDNNKVETTVSTAPYPNPAINMLNVPVRKGVKGNVTVEVYDLAGKLVISENKTINDAPLQVNVASISNGAYLFSLTFADGSKDSFKISVNR